MPPKENAALGADRAASKVTQRSHLSRALDPAQPSARRCATCFANLKSGCGYLVHGYRVCASCNAWHAIGVALECWRSA